MLSPPWAWEEHIHCLARAPVVELAEGDSRRRAGVTTAGLVHCAALSPLTGAATCKAIVLFLHLLADDTLTLTLTLQSSGIMCMHCISHSGSEGLVHDRDLSTNVCVGSLLCFDHMTQL